MPVPPVGPIFRPLNVYLCRSFDPQYREFICYFTVNYVDALLPVDCNTFVAGPFNSVQACDFYIESTFGVRRGEAFIC